MEEAAANANSSSSSIPKNYVTLRQLKEKHDASIMETAANANSSSYIPNNCVTLRQLKEEKHDASIMETAAKVNSSSSSSIPNNCGNLKHLQELRLKEKHDDEERLRNLEQEENEKKAAEERRTADESLIPKPHRRTRGSRHKWPSNRQKWVVVRLAPPRNSDADGAEGSASGAVQVPPIGKSPGSDTNPEVGRKQNPKKKKKKKKKNKGKADKEKNGGPEAAMAMATAEEESEEIKGSEKITADPLQESPVQVKEDGRRGRWTRAVSRPIGRLSGCGPQRTVPTDRRSVIVDDEAAAGAGRRRWTAARGGASNQRAGGCGRGRRSPDGAGLVWVRKTTST